MGNNEIATRENASPALPAEAMQAIGQIADAMRGMADMMRTTNERMTALEQQVRLLTKVTPMQASEINGAIRQRAKELCASYRADGGEKTVANAIRRDMRLALGVQNARDVPRCEYQVAINQVKIWDDYKTMKAIRARASEKAKGALGHV